MNRKQQEQLSDYIREGELMEGAREMARWAERVTTFLHTSIGLDAAHEFRSLKGDQNWFDSHPVMLGHLEGLLAREDDAVVNAVLGTSIGTAGYSNAHANSRKVFVVHGHDAQAKEIFARFLEKLGLEPVVLHEQPNQGRTIIEKFETCSSDVAFAVVLLTPDDVGAAVESRTNLRSRARQNVILELGYFIGRLGRGRVCALHKGGLELPSDYQGVIYIELDDAGGWKTKVAQEFVHAKLAVRIEGVFPIGK